MKQSGVFIKLMSVLLAFTFAFIAISPESVMRVSASDYGSDYDKLSPAQKQQYIEQHLKEVKTKLSKYQGESEETEEYVEALNEKISYLQLELRLSKETIESSKKRIEALEKQYNNNEREIRNLKEEIDKLTERKAELQEEFNESYELYAQRARALYVSGNMSTLSMLLSSEDISTLFTRLEMIKRVSSADKALLESLQNEGNELINTKASLEDKKGDLTANQATLTATKENLSATVKSLEQQQAGYSEKQEAYSLEKQEADKRLADLHDKTKEYGEFRTQDEKELEYLIEVNAQIAAAAEEFEKRMEAANKTTTKATTKKPTTKKATTKKTTTKKPTTTTTTTTTTDLQPEETSATTTTKKTTTSKKTTTTTTTTTTKKTTTASNKLSMTYPVPSQTKITCGYGAYSGHTGVDFACASNSRVVAVEDGEVIVSTDLKNSNGSYRSYGRYIVIAHYKKNSSGNYVYTLYAHNSSRVVSEGDRVTKGQLIAYSGSTGNSTGPHCHFEVRTPNAMYESCVNPTPYLP